MSLEVRRGSRRRKNRGAQSNIQACQADGRGDACQDWDGTLRSKEEGKNPLEKKKKKKKEEIKKKKKVVAGGH